MEVRKFEIVNDQANDQVMHDDTLGKRDGSAVEPLNSGTQSKIFPLNALRVRLANEVNVFRQVSLVSSPVVSKENSGAERCEQPLQLPENIVSPSAESVCENNTGFVVYCQPQPTLIFLAAHVTPHFIKFARYFIVRE